MNRQEFFEAMSLVMAQYIERYNDMTPRDAQLAIEADWREHEQMLVVFETLFFGIGCEAQAMTEFIHVEADSGSGLSCMMPICGCDMHKE